MRKLLLFLPILAISILALRPPTGNTYLTGKITDGHEDLIGASIKVLKGTTLIKSAATDVDGKYRIQLDPGSYDVEVSYSGYATQFQGGVQVLDGKLNTLDFVLSANQLAECVVTGYKVPLVERDMTSSGLTLTSEQIKNLPSRSLNAISANTTGRKTKSKKAAKEKASPTLGSNKQKADPIKGNRAPGTVYYIDGIRVQSKSEKRKKPIKPTHQDSLPPESSTEQYNGIVENPFQDARKSNISTFSIDVDRASYANLRRFLNSGQKPPENAVRIEEMVNYFDYQYAKPAGKHPFEVNAEVADCPWSPKHKLMMLGLQGLEMDLGQLPNSNFVFLIDVSGSMESADKLPLLIQSLEFLTDQLRANDRVAIVVYAGAAGLVLESTPGTDKNKIKEALQRLHAGGSTAGAAGIQLAYESARKNFIEKGNNRVILCTDGDFNVGLSSEKELEDLIEKERKSGVYLTVLGFGMGNYQDGKMQTLADKGNGNHAYIDQLSEAKKVFGKEFGGTLFTIAKDVKLQLHFNPKIIAGYRLIGYENRMLATEDFNDDTKDAGEVGSGHCVTALYELIPAGEKLPKLSVQDAALVVTQEPDKDVHIMDNDLMVLQLRYKKPEGERASDLMEYRLNAAALDNQSENENFLLASSVVEFGLLLRDSKYKGKASLSSAIRRAQSTLKNDPNGYRAELVRLMEQTAKIGL